MKAKKGYKALYEAETRRWDALREKLQTAVDLADAGTPNYDKTTILQVIFMMDSMTEEE